MAPSATTDAPPTSRNSPKPPPTRIWTVNDPPFEGYRPVDSQGWAQSNRETAIVIDNGSYHSSLILDASSNMLNVSTGSSSVRAGWSFDSKPRLSLPPLMARYRDRKLNRTFTFIGSDVYSDGTARGQSKNIYEPGSNIVNNWDVLEGVLDYCFLKLGVNGQYGSIDRPIVMTEPVANLGYTRRSTS